MPTSFSSSSAPTANTENELNSQECSACVKLLKSACNATRPLKLLSAMNAKITSVKDTSDVTVTFEKTNNISSFSNTESTSSATVLTSPEDNANKNEIISTTLNIACMKCGNTGPEGGARAFVKGPEPLSMVLCANRLFSEEEVEEVLVHELIHVYDVRVRGMDLRDCRQLAHSEVRAAREAECANTASIFQDYCVRRKATLATQNMFPGKIGRECVCDIFDAAIRDLDPNGVVSGKKRAFTSSTAATPDRNTVDVSSTR